MAFSENLSLYLADFGIDAIFGDDTTKVIFDQPTNDVISGYMLSDEYQITLPNDEFPLLESGSEITVNSTTYSVREIRLIDDGAFKTATLSQS